MAQAHTHTTWYQPLHNQGDIDMAVWWALARPGIFLTTVGDLSLLPRFLDAWRSACEELPSAGAPSHAARLA